jgi:hypothetical protein
MLALMVLKLVLSQAQKPCSLQTLMHHLISFISQLDMDIPPRGEKYHTVLMLHIVLFQPYVPPYSPCGPCKIGSIIGPKIDSK